MTSDLNAVDSAAAFLIDFNVADVPAAVGLEATPAAAAAMYGVTPEQFAAYAGAVAAAVEAEARRLLDDPALGAAVEAFPVAPGGRLLFIGDSITTYRRSYARLLEAMLQARRPADRITVVNGGRSGFTSSHGIELTYVKFLGLDPNLVTVGFGGNDCKRFGEDDQGRGRLIVDPRAYRENLAGIVDAFRRHTSARVVVVGPTPVIPARIAANPDFAASRVRWDMADLLACNDTARKVADERGLAFVDQVQALGEAPDPRLYLADGLHPGPAGHVIMLRALLRAVVPGAL